MLTKRQGGTRKTTRQRRAGAGLQRNPEKTRAHLLETAFKEIYRGGFRGTGLDQILERANVTKGALYHHFDNKEKLGYAIVDEVIAGINREKWVAPLEQAANPIDTLIEIVKGTSFKRDHIEGGCPLNNLAQEMSPLDEGLRWRIGQVFHAWIDAIAEALKRGQEHGQVRKELDPKETATQIVAMYEGYVSLAKNQQTELYLMFGVRALKRYLEELRAK